MSVTVEQAVILSTELRPALSAGEVLLEADRCLGCGGPYAAGTVHGGVPGRSRRPELHPTRSPTATNSMLRTRSSPRTCSAGRARASAPSRFCARAPACSSTKDGSDRDRRAPALCHRRRARDTGFLLSEPAPAKDQCVCGDRRGPSGMVCAGELAALGYTVTVFDEHDEVGGLVRYRDRTVPRAARSTSRRGSGRSRHSASSSGSARRAAPPRRRRQSRQPTPCFSASGSAPDVATSPTLATTFPASGTRFRSSRR